MIPNTSELLVLNAKYDARQQVKNEWKRQRLDALEYYMGRSLPYTMSYFDESLFEKVPPSNINVTKRIIDRVSLVYMKPPKRIYTKEETPLLFHQKDFKLQRLERMTNLLDAVLLKPCIRYNHDNEARIEYDIIWDYEPMFGDDPLTPTAFTYPIAVKDTVIDNTPEMHVYWDKDNTFTFDNNGKIYTNPDNPDMLNPYGVLPFVECYREGKPESSYLDTNASSDLIQTNTLINVAETNKAANIMFQSFGYIYINGSQLEKDELDIGPDKISFLGIDGTMNLVSPPDTVETITNAITTSYKMLAQNYHIDVSFVEGTTAQSGVAIKLRNQELTDERVSDVVRWQDFEQQLFELERRMIAVDLGQDAGELDSIDYQENVEILSDKEQREKWDWELANGLIDRVDILMQRDPDRFPDRDTAEDYLFERSTDVIEDDDEDDEDNNNNSLLSQLTKPV
ncbi:MAG: hypothetical protein Unbinned2716contig1004_18 [Prokaryotic dsDNA virus sp.]|nr:MAG: hypothetical protein Unbinned2716contig1004_18 [Prokaryotic dsDNA virus sp.]|tara:strand:- start:14352 stop:15713 length:1362 start_codon:yes stop_codon:yes gene_type:complete